MGNYKYKNKKKIQKDKFLKLRLTVLITILICSLTMLIVKTFIPSIMQAFGENAYKNNDYKKAAEFYKTAYLFDTKNKKIAYYLASSISKQPLTFCNQRDLYKITQRDDDSAADLLATTILKSFKVNIMMKVGGNYIEEAFFNNQVLHWNINTMPLNYYIDTTTKVPDYYINTIKKSFDNWEKKSRKIVNFKETQDKAKADIIVFFKDVDNSMLSKTGRIEYSVGEATPVIENNLLKQMQIQIITQNNLRQYFSQEEIATVTKHEIGHAIGLWGHSTDINDIMYYSASKDFGFFGDGEKEISPDDVNTLRLLYFSAPNITNKHIPVEELKHYLYAPIIVNEFEDNGIFYIQKCITNTIKTPNDISAWVELAGAYSANKDYISSIKTLEKTARMTSDPDNLAIIYYNMANDAINSNQPKEAMDYAYKAQSYKDDHEVRSLIAYIKYKQKDYAGAKADLEKLLQEQPCDIDNSLTLADIYIKQKKYWAARSIIKELLKKNPEAKNDDRLSYYRIYVLF